MYYRKYRKYIIISTSHPSIAQLVERWTVVEKSSIGRWFESGSKDFFHFAFHKTPSVWADNTLFRNRLLEWKRRYKASLVPRPPQSGNETRTRHTGK